MPDHDYAHLCGWLGVDDVQAGLAVTLPKLAYVGSHLFGAAPPSAPVLMYRAWLDILGFFPPYPAQQIGDCVSFGHGHGNDLLQAVEVRLGASFLYRETDTEFIYAAAREVAGILGPTDGCYGAAAVKAMTHTGMVSRAEAGSNGVYSGDRAKVWGAVGPPQALEAKAAFHKLGMAALVLTWDELVAAITNGYPVTICTSQGFNLVRDADGFCAAHGTWGHCMVIGGVRFDRPGACILQSWGPNVPTGPTALGQPDWSFWAERAVIETILGEGDSWALSRTPGFAERQLPPSWRYDVAA
jgi:hypothetical protein